MGLENIYKLTTNYKQYGLRIEGVDVDGNTGDANWDIFRLNDNVKCVH